MQIFYILLSTKVNGYFEEINKTKYLMLVPNNESKKELWSKIRDLIRLIGPKTCFRKSAG